MPQARERVVARVLALAVVLAGGWSAVHAELWRKPYPSLQMPRFASVPVLEGEASRLDLAIEVVAADGTTVALTERELTRGYPLNRRQLLVETFRNGDGDPAARVTWWSPRVLVEGWPRGFVPRTDQRRATHPDTVAWLRRQVARHVEDAESVVFTWTRVRSALPSGEVLTRELDRVVEVPL